MVIVRRYWLGLSLLFFVMVLVYLMWLFGDVKLLMRMMNRLVVEFLVSF